MGSNKFLIDTAYHKVVYSRLQKSPYIRKSLKTCLPKFLGNELFGKGAESNTLRVFGMKKGNSDRITAFSRSPCKVPGKKEMFSLQRKRVQVFTVAMVLGFTYYMGTLTSTAEENKVLVIGRFSSEGLDTNGFPLGWQLKNPGNKSKVEIEREEKNHSLHILCVNDNIAIGRKISIDVRQYPYLTWRWKASKLPEGGDIRKRETDEQAGQIYTVVPKFPSMVNTRSVGYIWDSQAPVGLSGTSTAYSKMKYVVLESGLAKLSQWICETRNVYEDYRRLFQEKPPTLGGVVLYINTQHSQSSAEISYADIFFSSSPLESLGKYAQRVFSGSR